MGTGPALQDAKRTEEMKWGKTEDLNLRRVLSADWYLDWPVNHVEIIKNKIIKKEYKKKKVICF